MTIGHHDGFAPQATGSTRRAILRALAGGAIGSAFLHAGWVANASVPRKAMETMTAPVPRLPARLVIVYGHPDDVDAFEEHYRSRHVPLAVAMPYCSRIESALAMRDPGGEEAAFHRIDTLTFENEADLAACVASEAGRLSLADIAEFASGGATATVVTAIEAFRSAADA